MRAVILLLLLLFAIPARAETPCQATGTGSPGCDCTGGDCANLPFDYNVGYQFTANVDYLQVTNVWIKSHDALAHSVRVYDASDGSVLVSCSSGCNEGSCPSNVNCTGSLTAVSDTWVSKAITPIVLTNGHSYVIAERNGSGNYNFNNASTGYYPHTVGSVTLNAGRFQASVDTMPSSTSQDTAYGLVDVTLVTVTPTPTLTPVPTNTPTITLTPVNTATPTVTPTRPRNVLFCPQP